MSTNAEVIVLRDDVRLEAVLALAEADGWALREETERAHLVLASRRWSASVGEEITYVADHLGGCHFLRITGDEAEALAWDLRDRFDHHTEDELLARVLGGHQLEPVAAVRVASKLAALRPLTSEVGHMRALERLMTHPVTAVRRAGIRSAYTCPWPELLELVERCRKREKHLVTQLEHLARYLQSSD